MTMTEERIKPIREDVVEEITQDILGSSNDVREAWMSLPPAVKSRLHEKWLHNVQLALDTVGFFG